MTTETTPSASAMLARATGRALGETLAATDGLTDEQLHAVVHPRANTLGWIAWHVFRTADLIGGRLSGEPELWVRRGHAAAWGLPAEGNGSGQPTEEAHALRVPSAAALAEYGGELREELTAAVDALDEAGLVRSIRGFGDRELPAGEAVHSFFVLHTIRHQGELNVTRTLLDLPAPGY